MRKLISFINMTLDGFCDHTAGIADDELHEHVNELFETANTILFGRKTYQLMEEAWPETVKNPTGNKPIDEFAVLIDEIDKVVFSNTLEQVEWKNTRLAENSLKDEAEKLKQQPGEKNILVGSRSIIIKLMQLGLVDELQFCLHPVILGEGLSLFENVKNRNNLNLVKIKTFGSGAVVLCYEPEKNENH